MLEFVRSATNFVQEWKGECRRDYIDARLSSLRSLEEKCPPEMRECCAELLNTYKLEKGKNSKSNKLIVKSFRSALAKFKKRYFVELQNQHMKRVLELVHPYMASRSRNRGISIYSSLSLANTIQGLIDSQDGSESLHELTRSMTLNELWERYHIRRKAGKSTKKTFARIKKLRKKIREGYKTGRAKDDVE